jgi:hypothetical protein
MGRDVSKQVQRMRRKARLALRRFDRAITQAPRFVELTEQQTGAA